MIQRLRVQRVKVFLCILAHDKLLTNFGRWPRGLVENSTCSRCNDRQEDALHMERDCLVSRDMEPFHFPTRYFEFLLFFVVGVAR